jgi:Ala-tRNA(Pro) deacylase
MTKTLNDVAHDVYEFLNRLNISFVSINHDPIFTSNREVEALKNVDVLDIKNLFLKGHKGKHHYLVVMPYDKPLDMKSLAALLEEKSLSFASEERMKTYLGVEPGAVSLFSLLSQAAAEVVVVIDEAVFKAERVGFHPNVATETLIFSQNGLLKILDCFDNEIRRVSINQNGVDSDA